MSPLDQLAAHQSELIRRFEDLQAENAILRQANEMQREELLRSHAELAELQKQNKHLQTVNAMLGGAEERANAKRKLTYMINLVDKALETIQE